MTDAYIEEVLDLMNGGSDKASGSSYLVVRCYQDACRRLEADVARLRRVFCHFPVVPGILEWCF
jgi:hypothetical protein